MITRRNSMSIRIASAALALMATSLIGPAALQAQTGAAGTAPAPQGLWAAQNSPTSVVLSWQAIPGAAGYRLHCAAGGAAPRLIGRPAGNATQWHLQLTPAMIGVDHRCSLEVQTTSGISGPVAFNPFVPQASGAPATPPASIAAKQTAPAEITVTWSDVAGATAYFIARSAGPEGFRVVCQLCPATASYVDRSVTPGVTYSYSVAAITPGGTSRRIGSMALVADPAYGQAATPATAGTGATTAGTGANATAAGGQSGGTAAAAATGGSQAGGAAATGTAATASGAGAVANRGATTTAGGRIGATGAGTAGNPGLRNPRVSTGTGSGGSGTGGSGSSTGSTHGSTAPQPCTLEYRRADNMWAAMGRPDGNLGAERITLQPGQTRAFVTDWSYEKKANDGTNYYGSHTRIASNPGGGSVEFRIRGEIDDPQYNPGFGHIVVHPSLLVTLQPGQSVNLKADLLEVTCK